MKKTAALFLGLLILACPMLRAASKVYNAHKASSVKNHKFETDSPERPVDTVIVKFGKNLVNLRTLDGYVLDDNGKWIHSPNRIPYKNPDFNNELYTKYKLGNDNISQINVVEMTVDKVPYLGILIEQVKGAYRNHSDSDFHYYTGADYYLIKPADFLKLWNDAQKSGKPYEVTLKVAISGLVGYRDIKKRPAYMIEEINKDAKNRIYTDTSVHAYLQFGCMPVKTKQGSYMRFYYGLAYARTGQPVPAFDFNVLKQKYYQVSLDLFHQFARPKSLVAQVNAEKARAKAKAAKAKAKAKAAAKPKTTDTAPAKAGDGQ